VSPNFKKNYKKNEEVTIMRISKKATILAILVVLVLSLIVSVQPVLACTAGCTPGFWKQPHHFEFWTDYSPDDTVGTVFTDAPSELADDTLLQALDYKPRGSAEKVLLRAAVATLLTSAYDAAHDEVDWGYGGWWTVERITDTVNWRLLNPFRSETIGLAKIFEGFNELGCPIKD